MKVQRGCSKITTERSKVVGVWVDGVATSSSFGITLTKNKVVFKDFTSKE